MIIRRRPERAIMVIAHSWQDGDKDFGWACVAVDGEQPTRPPPFNRRLAIRAVLHICCTVEKSAPAGFLLYRTKSLWIGYKLKFSWGVGC